MSHQGLFVYRLVSAILFCLVTAFGASSFDTEAWAQDGRLIENHQIKQEKFGGLRFGADIMIGAGRCDDHAFCALGDEQDWDEENTGLALMAQLELGYLWGRDFFYGPVITLSGGNEMWVNGDIRFRLVAAFRDSHAVNCSFGVGLTYSPKLVNTDNNNGSEIVNAIYLPFQVGYEYVFDNHFVLGVTVQYDLRLYRTEEYEFNEYHYPIRRAMGFFGGGLHLGYHF